MPPNTSASGGYLRPVTDPAALYDAALADFIHDVLVGLSGLADELVRPRVQEEPVSWPDRGADWVAFGVMRVTDDRYAVDLHDADDNGTNRLQRHETVEVRLSAYGPNSQNVLSQIKDGLQVEQNRAVMVAQGMGLKETGDLMRLPSLAKDKYLDRWDVLLTFRREVRRTYPVLSVLSASGVVRAEASTGAVIDNDFVVEPQP